MNIKKICKILGTTTAMMSILVAAGAISSTQAYAAEEIVQADSEVTTSSAVTLNENKKNDYAIDVNASVEKQGFKLTIKNITATRHNMKVVATIESSNLSDYNRDSSYDNIVQMTVKNGITESYGWSDRKINDTTVEYTFDIDSAEGFENTVQLRFDVLLGKYDLNAWLNTTVDISKCMDKVKEKDVQFSFGYKDFYKIESDILGTSIYYKEKDEDVGHYSDEDRVWESESHLLLKCNDKLYEVEEGNSYFSEDVNYIEGVYRTDSLKYENIDLQDNISLIPINCNIKMSEIDSIFDSERENNDYSEENNVKYNKEFKFKDNSKGIVSKVERNDDNVKLYISSPSEKDSILMALSMYGYYEYTEEDYIIDDNYRYIEKEIYKNPDEENGYIVEFDNVMKNRKFVVIGYDEVFSYNDKFDIGEEIKIK